MKIDIRSSSHSVEEAIREATGSDNVIVRSFDLFHWQVEWVGNGLKPLMKVCVNKVLCGSGIRGQLVWNEELLCALLSGRTEGITAEAEMHFTNTSTGSRCVSPRETIHITEALT